MHYPKLKGGAADARIKIVAIIHNPYEHAFMASFRSLISAFVSGADGRLTIDLELSIFYSVNMLESHYFVYKKQFLFCVILNLFKQKYYVFTGLPFALASNYQPSETLLA